MKRALAAVLMLATWPPALLAQEFTDVEQTEDTDDGVPEAGPETHGEGDAAGAAATTPAPPVDAIPPSPRVASLDANAVGRDVYLAGSDVLGPLAFLPGAPLLVPALAGIWAGRATAEGLAPVAATPALVVAAYAGAMAFEAAALAAILVTGVLFAAVQVPLYAAQYALVYGWTSSLAQNGVVSIPFPLLLFYLGLGTIFQGMNFLFFITVLQVPRLAGSMARVQAGDAALGAMGRAEPSMKSQPSPTWSTPSLAGLLAMTISGSWTRSAAWSFVPVVGPFIAWKLARAGMHQRVDQAHRVAGRAPSATSAVAVDVWLATRAFSLAALQGIFLSMGVLQVAAGILVALAALALAVSAPVGLLLALLVGAELLLILPALAPPLMALMVVGFVADEALATPVAAGIAAVTAEAPDG